MATPSRRGADAPTLAVQLRTLRALALPPAKRAPRAHAHLSRTPLQRYALTQTPPASETNAAQESAHTNEAGPDTATNIALPAAQDCNRPESSHTESSYSESIDNESIPSGDMQVQHAPACGLQGSVTQMRASTCLHM